MPRTFQLIPGIAAYLGVKEVGVVEHEIGVVFLSFEKGAVVGNYEKPLAKMDWPLHLRAEINKHFSTVFTLEHEQWKLLSPSPRARYCDNLQPWTVTCSP